MLIPTGRPEATACMVSADGKFHGYVRFYAQRCGVFVVAELCGLPDGFHGFHIHEGCCTGAHFADAGGHFNPDGAEHPNHAGDLPPLLSCGGAAFLAFQTGRFCLQDVLGRAVVIHEQADDFHSQPAGDSGEKLACGIIRKQ